VGIEGGHDICFDPVFKAVFTRDTPDSREALASLIHAVTGIKVEILEIAANEPPVDNQNDRQIRFDIHCKINEGDLADVEMTLYPDAFEPVRLEYHAAKLFSGQDIKGQDKEFSDLKSAYQISFLVNRSFYQDEELVHSFEYYDKENGVSLGGRSRIFTVELKKLGKTIEKPVTEMNEAERWAVFFRYLRNTEKRGTINEILERERGIEMASRELLKISKEENERARMISEYKFITDHQSKVVHARREGWDEAKQEFLSQLKSGKSVDELIKMYS